MGMDILAKGDGSDMDKGMDAAGKTAKRVKSYSLEVKRQIVEETFAPGASVSIVARRHNVNTNMVFGWRNQYREGTLRASRPAGKATSSPESGFVPVGIVEDAPMLPAPIGKVTAIAPPTPHRQPIVPPGGDATLFPVEIELPNRVKLRVDVGITETALRRLLSAAAVVP